jgi:hypothetical protein
MPQSLTTVWVGLTCEILENETIVFNREQAHNADMGANDPRTDGPYRTQRFNASTEALLEETWLYFNEPVASEAAAIAAWQAVMDAPIPEDGLPANDPPPMAVPPEE